MNTLVRGERRRPKDERRERSHRLKTREGSRENITAELATQENLGTPDSTKGRYRGLSFKSPSRSRLSAAARALGERLRFLIGRHVAVDVGPGRLVEWRGLRLVAIRDRAKRGCQHDACDAGVTRGTQHAQRPVARGSDQFVFVFGSMWRHRRSHVEHILAAVHSLRPPRIGFEIRGDKRHAIARLGPTFPQHGADLTFAMQISNCRPHLMTRGEQLQDRMAADETRASRDQNSAH